MSELQRRLEALAHAPVLLVATDYDGTLAPIVGDPTQAVPHRESMVALRALAALPCTEVAIISGRSLSDLAQLSEAPESVHLVGSHGSEFDPGFAENLSQGARELREEIERQLATIAEGLSGLSIETKPASVAFHYRNASREEAEKAVQAVLDGPAKAPGIETRTGKKVIELSVVRTDKGQAVETLRQRFGATATIFLGDDVTDEDAFGVLSGPDLGLKIGPGETRAPFRLDGPIEVARLLAGLAEARQEWFAGAQATPIEEHSMLSDLRTVALLDPRARVTWFCAPRIDSSALFAELLGSNAGAFGVRASDGSAPLRQSYVEGSLVLRSRFKRFSVTDFLDCSLGRPTQRAGRTDLVRVIEGSGECEIEFAPRLDFGRIETEIVQLPEGLKVVGGVDGIVLRSEGVEWQIVTEGAHQTARAKVDLGQRPLVLELRFGTTDLSQSPLAAHDRERRTREFWRSWSESLRLPSVAPDLVRHSAVVLRGLCQGPTGAIAAAATTSLPEHLGGIRNWDYRYCWLRDGALSAEALVRLGSVREAMAFLDWVLAILERTPEPDRLHPLYTVTGAELGPEAEITELSGYGGSRPVRVGNAASQQIQLDVFGPIARLIALLYEAGAPLSLAHWNLLEKMTQAVRARWMDADHGIWEIRAKPRHHTYTKVMCWLTLERAAYVSERFHGEVRQAWIELAETIRTEVIEQAWNEQKGTYTAAYGSEDLDAAILWVGLAGMHAPGDERFARTVEAVQRELGRESTVYRYLNDDGLPGKEGGFNLCTSWLVDALILVGRIDEAEHLFQDLVGLAGATGCLAEEYDPESDRALGNHPQAYTHLGVILNALHLSRARQTP